MTKPYAGLALLTDLDGTLLMPDKTLSPEDAAAIADFRAKGGLFSVATGRGMQATKPYLELLRPDYPAVMYNGALLYDAQKQETAATSHLPAEAGSLLRELMQAFPEVGAEVLDETGVYVIQDGAIEREHLAITHIPVVLKDFDTVRPEECMKALFAGEPEDIARMLEYVKAPRFAAVDMTRSHRWFLEILPADTNKGTALRKLREMIPSGTAVGAAGDFDNDIAMLREADICGCPADAQPAVKAAVRQCGGFISEKTCENGFFADWIHEFIRRNTR